jgi:hypothetical protein
MKGLRTLCSRTGFSRSGVTRGSMLETILDSMLTTRRALARVTAAALVLLLSACGGGGGSGGGGFLGPEGPESYDIQLSLVDGSGNTTTELVEGSPTFLAIRVVREGSSSVGIQGAVVTVSGTITTVAENGQVLTDSDGNAQIEVFAGTEFGADTLLASVTSPAGEVSQSIGVSVRRAPLRIGYFDGAMFVPGELSFGASTISFGSETTVQFSVVDENDTPLSRPVDIEVSSTCSLQGSAGFRPAGTDDTPATGVFSLTISQLPGALQYVALGCDGTDTVTVRLAGGDNAGAASASSDLEISRSSAEFIGFVCAEPAEGQSGADRSIIAPRNTGGAAGGRPEVARLTFQVLAQALPGLPDSGGLPCSEVVEIPGRQPLSGVPVSFELTNATADIELSTFANDRDDQGRISGVTDENGLITVEVRSGFVTTQTFVVASFDAEVANGVIRELSSTSNQIVVSSGIPDENSFTMGVLDGGFIVENAFTTNGVSRRIRVTLADRFNNPVPDGTAVTFRTEYGGIDASCLTNVAPGARLLEQGAPENFVGRGFCEVLWTSQAPRLPSIISPAELQTTDGYSDTSCASLNGTSGECPDDLGPYRGARSTVTAYVLGEEDFVDQNGNGLYDEGEPFSNLLEAFIDFNEDGVYTPEIGPECGPPSSDENCETAGFEEEFIDFNQNGIYDVESASEQKYTGTLCTPDAEAQGFCERGTLHVWDSLVLTLAPPSGSYRATLASGNLRRTEVREGGGVYTVYVADIYNNPPASDPEVVVGGGCFLRDTEGVRLIENTLPRGARSGAITLDGIEICGDGEDGFLNVTLDGVVIESFNCNTQAPADPNTPNFSPQPPAGQPQNPC